MCSSSSKPGATNEALDYLHQVCLRQDPFCRFVLWGGIILRLQKSLKVAFSVKFGGNHMCCAELWIWLTQWGKRTSSGEPGKNKPIL